MEYQDYIMIITNTAAKYQINSNLFKIQKLVVFYKGLFNGHDTIFKDQTQFLIEKNHIKKNRFQGN